MTTTLDATPVAVAEPVGHLANEVHGVNFWRSDGALRDLMARYLPSELLTHLEPHFDRLGQLAGGRLDELARHADRNAPVLHARDKFGRDEDWIEYPMSYREMEKIAFEEFGLHAITHRGGVLGWENPLPASAKYALQYLFGQAEFGLLCPISVSETSAYIIQRFGSPALKQYLLPRMLSQDSAMRWTGAQFMTEKAGGSDVGANETIAEHVGLNELGLDEWKLSGDKWFCSHTDGDVVMILARPTGAGSGTRGLGLFAMPRRLPDGRRNSYRIARLKDKLGTRSMASGEVLLDGATAYLVGDLDRGFAQMMHQVNLSRISHGARAAAMMRRCLNEAMVVAQSRTAFGGKLIEKPLLRRQLMKIMVPTEQALSMFTYAAHLKDISDDAALRLITPLLKFRTCRDNIKVAAAALEVRGGNGYIEDFVNARLVRDAQIGTIWEGTSNINALDAVTRAVKKDKGNEAVYGGMQRLLDATPTVPVSLRVELEGYLERALDFIIETADSADQEAECRTASTGLYNAITAILLATEGGAAGAAGGDARRLLVSRLVINHRLQAKNPLSPQKALGEDAIIDRLLTETAVPLDEAIALIEAATPR